MTDLVELLRLPFWRIDMEEKQIKRKKTFKELGPLEGWIDEMLENYSMGKDDIEVFSDMGISMRAVREYYELSDTFAEAVEFGRQLSQSFWHKKAREGATGDTSVNASMMKLNMGNRWGWTERTQEKAYDHTKNNAELTASELKDKFLSLLQRNMEHLLPPPIEGEFTPVVEAIEHKPAERNVGDGDE